MQRILLGYDAAPERITTRVFLRDDGLNFATSVKADELFIGRDALHCRDCSRTSLEQAAECILFPQEVENLQQLRRIASDFGIILDDVTNGIRIKQLKRSTCITPQDLADIQHAHAFASTCSSLFEQVVGSSECGQPHRAMLYVPGAERDGLMMDIGACGQRGWVPATFKQQVKPKYLTQRVYMSDQVLSSSNDAHSPEPPFWNRICMNDSSSSNSTRTIQIAFNSENMWEDSKSNRSQLDSTTRFNADQYNTLGSIMDRQPRLDRQYRLSAAVLFALFLVRMNNSPWVDQLPGYDTISLPPINTTNWPDLWFPRISCSLAPRKQASHQASHQAEYFASFGVLIMELYHNEKAEWTEADNDIITKQRSNIFRLARILREWKAEVSGPYCAVAKTCLEFASLSETNHHRDIDYDQENVANIYKYIFQPLLFRLSEDFDITELRKFAVEMMPSAAIRSAANHTSSTVGKQLLFDDDDLSSSLEERRSASDFLESLGPFRDMISGLREAGTSKQDRVRIAVLDSGVNADDAVIDNAIDKGIINRSKSKSFISLTDDWRQDTYGHGTHVTQLLLTTAPAAEICVAKICTRKMLDNMCLDRIAEAIDWAVEECHADIISMAFGYLDYHKLIDEAIGRAVANGKLIFAAASNNGALQARARPANRRDVFCVHATDGKGNKGPMNPTPLDDTENFATLGVAVNFFWGGDAVWKSGTSYATPIAAGFAADILELANHSCTKPMNDQKKMLYTIRGMLPIFKGMAVKRDGYDILFPMERWPDNRSMEGDIANFIEKTLQNL